MVKLLDKLIRVFTLMYGEAYISMLYESYGRKAAGCNVKCDSQIEKECR